MIHRYMITSCWSVGESTNEFTTSNTEEMILPEPVRFLTACRFDEVALQQAFGDELFLALHLVMKGTKNYMKHLKHYHEQHLAIRDVYELRQRNMMVMEKYGNYKEIPTPEEIREVVAECLTATVEYSRHFIRCVNDENNMTQECERENTRIRMQIGKLGECYRGETMCKALCDILRMPASKVGTNNSFHHNNALMGVAMRQFGIALMVVHEVDKDKDTWPYQTTNFLDEHGEGAILPITYGLIHVYNDGNLSILRQRSMTKITTPTTSCECYDGYAMDLMKDVRGRKVTGTTKGGGDKYDTKAEWKCNLMTGLFYLGYAGFAEFILDPKTRDRQEEDEWIPFYRRKNYEDYREVPYQSLVSLRRLYDRRIIESLDTERRAESMGARQDGGESTAERRARNEGPEMKLSSYAGKNDQEKMANRQWFLDEYEQIWRGEAPRPEDLSGMGMTIGQCLRLIGKSIKTMEECMQFFPMSTENSCMER